MTKQYNESQTYKWQYQSYVTWKGNCYNESSFINSRPDTNGSWIMHKESYDKERKDGNAFLPRPIKHWRKQLESDSIRGGTKNVNIYDINTPGLYNILNNRNCCSNQINNNENQTSHSITSNIQIKNNSIIYDNSETKVDYGDNPECWYCSFGKRICCNPENNLITYKTQPIENNYITYSNYFKHKCYKYNQSISTTKIKGNVYFNQNGIAKYPTNSTNGCQILKKKDCSSDCCDNEIPTQNISTCKTQPMIYKPNNRQFAIQGATTCKNRISRLKMNTIDQGGALFNNANGLKLINNGICGINGDSIYYVKTKPETCITEL